MRRTANLGVARSRLGIAPSPRCDVCLGEGLLELMPVVGGRWACPVCRHALELREKASAEAKK
jgi:hypothetical protein